MIWHIYAVSGWVVRATAIRCRPWATPGSGFTNPGGISACSPGSRPQRGRIPRDRELHTNPTPAQGSQQGRIAVPPVRSGFLYGDETRIIARHPGRAPSNAAGTTALRAYVRDPKSRGVRRWRSSTPGYYLESLRDEDRATGAYRDSSGCDIAGPSVLKSAKLFSGIHCQFL